VCLLFYYSDYLLPVSQVQRISKNWERRSHVNGEQRGRKLLDELHRLTGDAASRHHRDVILFVHFFDAVLFRSSDANLPTTINNGRLAVPAPVAALPPGASVPGPYDVLTNPIYQCMSLPESRAKTLCRKQPQRMLEHTEAQLVRVYPAGMRIDSSNFNPIPFWSCGIQMAVRILNICSSIF